ncbi:MAG: hypothetical protein Q8O67_21220 [Deltaproteobacteria bacterium]|nr:hypothetical protein [Deltaproteobacteria bacterium]
MRVVVVVVVVLLPLLGCEGGVPTTPKANSVRVIDALGRQPLANLPVRVDGDAGIRCAVAPCDNETSTWSGTTDGEGRLALPALAPHLRYRLSAKGYDEGVDLTPGSEVRLPPAFLFTFDHTFTPTEQEQLLACFGGDDDGLRATCGKAISRNRDGAVGLLPGLLALRDGANPKARVAALTALAEIPGAPMQASPNADLRARFSAASAAARGKSEVSADVAAALMAWLEQAPAADYDAADRIAFSWPWKTLLPELLRVLRDGTEEQRDRASLIVYDIMVTRDASHTGPLGQQAGVTLLAALERGPSTVRARAGMSLGLLSVEQTQLRPLLEKHAKSADADLQDSAARGLRMADDAIDTARKNAARAAGGSPK